MSLLLPSINQLYRKKPGTILLRKLPFERKFDLLQRAWYKSGEIRADPMLEHPDLEVTLEQDIGRRHFAVEALETIRSEDMLKSPGIRQDDVRKLGTDVHSNSGLVVSESRPRISEG